jgi:hypothetical protein
LRSPAGAGVPQQPVWPGGRRPHPQEQDVLLRRLAGHAAAHRNHPPERCAHTGAAQRRLHHRSLRSGTSPRTPFANNTIPASRFDPLAVQVLQHYPQPNAAGANNFILTGVEPDKQDQFDGALTISSTKASRLCALLLSARRRHAGAVPSRWQRQSHHGRHRTRHHPAATASRSEYDWTLSPTTLNQARFGYTRRAWTRHRYRTAGSPSPARR